MHSPTLLILASILMGMMFAILLAVWHFNRRIPGLKSWTLSYFFAFLFCLTFLLRSRTPEVLSVATAQASILLAGYLCLRGCHAYLGKRPFSHRYAASAIAALVALSVYFTVVEPHTDVRFLISSLGPGIFFLLSAFTVAQGQAQSYPARYMCALACGGHGLFLMARPWLFTLGSDGLFNASHSFVFPQFILLESIIALIFLAFSVLILVNEHITIELRLLAEKDPLTGVFNRRAFLILLDKATSMAHRANSALPVLLIDLDHFKRINDTWGHKSGDDVLRHFSAVVTNCLRNEDVMGRMGGEEFAIFLPNASFDDASVVAERLRAMVASQPITTAHDPIALTVSIGVTLCVKGELPEIALHRADKAMYRAKEQGRNRVASLTIAAVL